MASYKNVNVYLLFQEGVCEVGRYTNRCQRSVDKCILKYGMISADFTTQILIDLLLLFYQEITYHEDSSHEEHIQKI